MENEVLYKIMEILPDRITCSLKKAPEKLLDDITEIRLRSDNVATVTCGGENLYICDTGILKYPLRFIRVSYADIEDFIYKLCGGSVYSYEASIRQGYITTLGARVGLSGKVIVKNNEMCGFSRITGVNIRIPHHISGVCEDLISHIEINGFTNNAGILVSSAPGIGKTTVLRELAIRLSRGIKLYPSKEIKAFRVTIIDERNEIFMPQLFDGCMADVLSGINKKAGLECASRVLSPEIIICDEIGSEKDADAISASHIGGVTFIASIHSESINDIFSKKAIQRLCSDNVFSHLYLLKRENKKVVSSLIDIREYLK